MIQNRTVCALSVAAVVANTVSAHAGDADGSAYIRFGVGAAFSENGVFRDDVCDGPPATLFGCGTGNDSRALGAYGDFGTSVLIDGGIGLWLQDWLRAEATVSYRPDFDFNGAANFTQTNADQPVASDVDSFSVMATGHFYPAPLLDLDTGPVAPFVSAGLGIAHNKTSSMVYTFPQSTTTTQPGSSTDFAWSLGAGVDVDVTGNWVASLAYRYSHLGYVRTDPGNIAVVVPPSDPLLIPVRETRAPLSAHEIFFSLRYEFVTP